MTKAQISDDKPGLLSPKDPDIQFSGGMLLAVHAAWLRPLTSRAAGRHGLWNTCTTFGGGLSRRKCCTPKNRYPEKRNPGFCAFRSLRLKPHGTCEALELKSGRLSRQSRPLVPAGDLVKQGLSGFKGLFLGGLVFG